MNPHELIENELFEQLTAESALTRQTIRKAISLRDQCHAYNALTESEQLTFRQGNMNWDYCFTQLEKTKSKLMTRMS